MNDIAHRERPLQRGEPPRESQTEPPVASHRGIKLLRRIAPMIIPAMFVTQLSNLTLMRYVRFPEEGFTALPPRMIVSALGILFGFGILAVQRAARNMPLFRRALMALGCGVLGAAWHTIVNFFVFAAWFPDDEYSLSFYVYGPAFFDWLWFYTAVSLMILAMTYVADIADNEERMASLQARANAFQLRALRYQLNPHFLFNTLNAIASLISRRNNAEAEAMVVGLSDFLRSTLRIDPAVDITLGEEIALQSLYLDIERSRFPHRLRVTIDVPDELRDACVPNLILQPLIENAIKHGVAQSEKEVHLEISAAAQSGRLSLEVRDNGGDAAVTAPGGANVGLANVADRLRVHYGDDARFTARRRPEGGFSARIEMPLRLAA
jgi:signal transduction histidine kinase